MNSCAEIRDSIGAWLDGELVGERADSVRLHVESCAACAEEQRQLAELDLAMRTVLESEAARLDVARFWPEIRRRIEARSPSWYERVAEWAAPVFRAPSFAWAVPAVIVLLIGALYFDLFTQSLSIGSPRNNFATVESIDAYGRNVALLREHESKTTVIWLYQNPDSENEAAGEVVDKGPAF
jgi:predicted anti-sigma-YlaC factor YlaD